MKVHELISILSDLDPDAIVILQKDAEGNGYSPAADVETGEWDEVDGVVYDDIDDADDAGCDVDDLVSCVVVWPV